MTLDFEFVGFKDSVNSVLVDGKVVKLEKEKDENKKIKYIYSHETNKNTCDVVIYKSHNYEGKHWFWWNLLYFFISVFGIFDSKNNTKFAVIDASFKVTSDKDAKVLVKRLDFTDKGKLVSVETDASVEEFSNIQYYDKEAKKKHAKMKKAKIGVTIATVLLIAALIAFL